MVDIIVKTLTTSKMGPKRPIFAVKSVSLLPLKIDKFKHAQGFSLSVLYTYEFLSSIFSVCTGYYQVHIIRNFLVLFDEVLDDSAELLSIG